MRTTLTLDDDVVVALGRLWIGSIDNIAEALAMAEGESSK
jgi:hypothetical protein